MKEKQAVTREYIPRYQKVSKKTKRALPDEFIFSQIVIRFRMFFITGNSREGF
jgi:hypothetical protein